MRSFLAVLAGFVLWSVLWLGGDRLTRALFPAAFPADFPATPMTATAALLAVVALSVVCSYAAGWLTGRFAGARARTAVLVLALLLLAVGIAVQAQVWTALPLWYQLAFLGLLVPVTWLGGRRPQRV